MPSIVTHVAVPLALWLAADRGRISPRLLTAGMVASVLPDADTLAFTLGIAYADAFGHRGASHSIVFSALCALMAAIFCLRLHSRPLQAATFVLVSALSHPLLDALTSGGLGVALLWPWSEARWFAPWRPILVSPFAHGFFNARGLATLWSELRWVWLPLLTCAALWRAIQGRAPRTQDLD